MNKRIFQTVLLLMLALFGSTSLLRADELTVYDGTTTNSYVPIYGYYADCYVKSEYIIPATDLEDMAGGTINDMKFYLSSPSTAALTGIFQVYLAEVDETSISAFYTGDVTVVYEGTVNTTLSIMTIEFSQGYTYMGGNLLVGFVETQSGNYKSCSFYGQTASGSSVQGYNCSSPSSISPSPRNFIPKTTFIYEAGSLGERYSISTVSNLEGAGTLTGAGTYFVDTECTLTATTNQGYYFINWTLDGEEVSTASSYTFTVSGDAVYVANFGAYPVYNITAVANPEDYGYVSGFGSFYEDDECVLSATCYDTVAYYFINWTLDGTVVSTEPVYTFTVRSDGEYVANFGAYPIYNVLVTSALDTIGTIMGGGSFYEGQTCIVYAVGEDNLLFTNWTANGHVVSTTANYTFTVTEDVTLVANFVEYETLTICDGTITNQWTPIWFANSSNYLQSQYVMPAEYLEGMVGKSIKGLKYYLSTPYQYAYPSQFRVYLTEFGTETINAFVDPTHLNMVYTGLMTIVGNELTIVFDVPYDYYGGHLMLGIDNLERGQSNYALFYGVDKRDASVSNSGLNPNFSNFGYAMQTNFLPKTTFFFDDETAPLYEITASVNPEDAGHVEGTGDYSEGYTCTLTAVKELGYRFVNWTLNGEEVSTEASYSFTVTGDAEYVANFELSGSEDIELTVFDGTSTSNVIPLYIFYFDSYTKSQYVIPAEDLVDIMGGEISAMKYYSSNTTSYTTGCEVDVYLKEVDYTTITEYEDKSTAQVVYTGTLSLDANQEMLITFDTPFTYHGGNLLVGTENLTTTGYKNVSFYGTTVEGASIGGQNSSGSASAPANQKNFIPKTTFYAHVDFVPAALSVTPNPIDMGYRPLGAWMKPFWFDITNNGGGTTVNDMYLDNDFLQLGEFSVPFTLPNSGSYNMDLYLGEVEEGAVNANLVLNYGNNKTAQFPVSAIAYTPVAGDVWENALEVTVPYTGTAPAGIHYNYDIPGGNANYNDAVYKVNVDQLSMLNVTTGDAESTFAVYTEEGFDGVGGPDLNNTYNYSLQLTTQASEFFEDFENGFPEGWNNYDLDGDNFHWQLYSEVFSTTNACHNGSQEMITSSSYDRFTNVALTPDNYLVTPLVSIADGSVFSFWACAQDANYASEHFGVAVSPDDGYYTMIQEWTLGAKSGSPMGGVDKMGNQTRGTRAMGNWYQFVVDLSAYAGEQLYIAIRHFNCTDMFYLNVDDIELSTGRGRDAAQAGVTVDVGTYYVVVASAEQEFPVNINLNAVPTPVAAQMVYPADNAVNIEGPCTMTWTLGDYTQEMQVLFGTQYPPTDVLIDWTDELVSSMTISELESNTAYFVQINERNYTGTTEGTITSFVSHLDVPQLYSNSWYAYEDGDIRFYWDAIEDEGFISYNVYVNDSLYVTTTDTDFVYTDLEYNLSSPYIFEVSAVYELGESNRSEMLYFYVSGYGTVEGHVYEQDGTTPIAEALVYIYGNGVFGDYFEQEFVTDEEGAYSGVVPVSYNYCYGYAWKDEYQGVDHGVFSVMHQDTISDIDFVMNEVYYPVASVTAEEVDENAEVEWSLNERSFQYYRLYRSDAYNTNNPVLVADSIFETAFVDEAWAEMPVGAYRYGVSAMYQGNHQVNRNNEFTYGFEDDLEGWTSIVVNSEGGEWIHNSSNLGGYDYSVLAHTGTGFAMCYSYVDYQGAFNTDAYFVSPQMFTITDNSTMTFWADNANDSYPESFSICVASADNPTADDFTEIWNGSAKGANTEGAIVRHTNNRYENWREHVVDLSDLAGQTVWIAFHDVNYDMYEVWIDDITINALNGGGGTPAIPGLHESAITWSDVIDKDMYLSEGEMSLTVTLNSGDSPEGTYVELSNVSFTENYMFPVEPVYLDETGTYTWDNFRKGTYWIMVYKDGYEEIYDEVSIYEPTALTYELVEITSTAKELYVSPTGYAMWDGASFDLLYNAQATFYEDFENGLPEDWTVIDADGDGFNWQPYTEVFSNLYSHNGSSEMMTSSSYDRFTGKALTPDNYLVTPPVKIFEGSTFSFWACAQDASWPYEYFGVAVSENGRDFTMVEEWTMTAKGGAPKGDKTKGGRMLGNWYQYSVDLSEYAGEQLFVAIRHFNCTDWYYLNVDDVELTVNDNRHYIGYNVVVTDLAGVEVVNEDTEDTQIQLPVDDLVEGETYLCKVAKVYSSVTSAYLETSFVYTPCENYAGTDYALVGQTDEGNLLVWDKPDTNGEGGWMYYDRSMNGCRGALNGYNLEFYDGWYWGVMFPAGTYSGNVLSKIQLYQMFDMDYAMAYIYNGGDTVPENLVATIDNIQFVQEGGWVDYDLDSPVMIDAEQNVWVILYCPDPSQYGASMCVYIEGENSGWVSSDGTTWVDYGDQYSFKIRAYFDQYSPMGALIYRNDELLGIHFGSQYVDEEGAEDDDYIIRLVYPDYAMSCEQEVVPTSRYEINAMASNDQYGTVTGGGVYFEGLECTLTAQENENGIFVHWIKNGEVVSDSYEYTFVVEDDADYVAYFVSNSNYWTADPSLYEYSMTVTGIVKIDDEVVASDMYEIAAFVGDECRGNARLTLVELDTVVNYVAFLTIYGETGDELTFQLYDHYNEELVDMMCTNQMTFVADENVGTLFDPYVFNFMNVITVDYEFTPGWNWWSTHVELTAIDGMAMLEEGVGEEAIQISSQTSFTNYYAGYGWYGSLVAINNESMYRVQMTNGVEFSMVGPKANPADHPITLTKGWNHIGYVSGTEMSVNDALVGITPQAGDMVKSQKSYANYYAGYGWYGSLNTIKPGDGLMYKSVSDDAITFTYPSVGGRELAENLTGDNNHWVPNVYAYPSNMTVMAVVEMDGTELASDHYELAAFINGECRGSIQLVYAEPLNRYVAFLTVSGEEVANMSFGLYNTETGEEFLNANTVLTFNADAVVGKPDELFVIDFRGTNAINESVNAFTLYPNPVSMGEKVNLLFSTDSMNPVRIEIVDALGKVVSVESSANWPASVTVPSSAGIYTVRIITEDNGVMIQKMVVK